MKFLQWTETGKESSLPWKWHLLVSTGDPTFSRFSRTATCDRQTAVVGYSENYHTGISTTVIIQQHVSIIWYIASHNIYVHATRTITYDTIRDAILTCARKPTWISLIYRTQPTTKKCKNRKTKSRKQICSEITVNSPGNPCSEYLRRRNEGLQWEGSAEKKVLSLEWKSEWVVTK